MATLTLLWPGGDGNLYSLSRADIFTGNSRALSRYIEQREAGASEAVAQAASTKLLEDFVRVFGTYERPE